MTETTPSAARVEAAREEIEVLAGRFADTAGSVVREALGRAMERFVGDHAKHFDALDDGTTASFHSAVDDAIAKSAEQIATHLRDVDLWLSPRVRLEEEDEWQEEGSWWEIHIRRRKHSVAPDEQLDDHDNRVWIALLNAARGLDPVLQEFGFEPGRGLSPDPGGGRFGLQPQTERELDPHERLTPIWHEYLGAFARFEAAVKATHEDKDAEERRTALRRWKRED